MTKQPADPYALYLELPPGPRPPHYYDLLGLELFCSHRERIEHAVRKQFRLVKPYQEHPDRAVRETVQDIMNTLAQARVVLTHPTQKDSYDVKLAAELGIDRDEYLSKQVAAPLPEFELVVIAGPTMLDERVHLVEGTTVEIGSDTNCALPLKGGRLEKRHCRVRFDDGDWWVESIDPPKTIHMNEEPCESSVLNDADFIDVGGYRLRLARISASRDGHARPAAARSRFTPDGAARLAPPLSLIIQKGPSIISPTFKMLAPQRVVVGSADPALWHLPHPAVARRHCAIQSVGDRWEAEDLGSPLGTRVNDVEIMRHMFHDRDILTIGPFEIMISLRM